MEYRKIIRYLEIGLVSFFILILVCILIRPMGLGANSGISYYGVFGNTILPYSLAFLTISVATWRASMTIDKSTRLGRYTRFCLQIFTVLFVGLLLTPHTILANVHVFFGSTLFVLQLVLGTVLVFAFLRDLLNEVLLLITFLSGVASFTYLNAPSGYMLESQIIFQLSIWILFIRTLWHFEAKKVGQTQTDK